VEIGKDEIPTTGGSPRGDLNYFQQCRDIRPLSVCVLALPWSHDASGIQHKNGREEARMPSALPGRALSSRQDIINYNSIP
jgi:hypothetical protein